MKKWIAEFLALAISISSQTALYGAAEDRFPRLGKEIVQEVEIGYAQGQYTDFLAQLHEQYQHAGKAGAIKGIFESAKAALQMSPEKVEEIRQKYETQITQLNQERNQRLLDAIAENPDVAIVQKVDAVVFFSQVEEEKKALTEIENLKFELPETVEATIDNKISALAVEYYIKSLLLDAAVHHGKTGSDLTKKKIAIDLEKFDKMKKAAEQANHPEWLQKISKAKKGYITDKSYKIDLSVLNDLAAGKLTPENSVEEKVKEIMMDYLQQKQSTFGSEIVQK